MPLIRFEPKASGVVSYRPKKTVRYTPPGVSKSTAQTVVRYAAPKPPTVPDWEKRRQGTVTPPQPYMPDWMQRSNILNRDQQPIYNPYAYWQGLQEQYTTNVLEPLGFVSETKQKPGTNVQRNLNQPANNMMYSFPGMPRYPVGTPTKTVLKGRELYEYIKNKYKSPKLVPNWVWEEMYGKAPTIYSPYINNPPAPSTGGGGNDGGGYTYYGGGGGGGGGGGYSPRDWMSRMVNWRI